MMESTMCTNCGNTFQGRFCNLCGQKVFSVKDKKLSHILNETFHFLTHFEGKFLKTMRTVLASPGKLSRDYCAGIRQRYYKPISFFLLLIIIYLIFPFMEGLNMRLEYYRGVDGMGEMISQQIDAKMAASQMTEQELAKIFRSKSEKTAKILLLILIPLCALALKLLFFRSRKTAYDYMILATEINIFVLLVFFTLLPFVLLLLMLVLQITGFQEQLFLPVLLIIFAVALTAMFRTFFSAGWISAIVKSLAFIFCYYVISQIIYKTLLFELTLMLI